MDQNDRQRLRQQLRTALSKYRGGRFVVSSSGGSSGMVTFVDSEGQEFFVGGLNGDNAQRIVDALNAVMELMSDQ